MALHRACLVLQWKDEVVGGDSDADDDVDAGVEVLEMYWKNNKNNILTISVNDLTGLAGLHK